MSLLPRLLILILILSFVSCTHEKVCSGLNPDIGTYNSSKKIRKGKRTAHSDPEREAIRRRKKTVKKQKSWGLSKTTGKPKGIFHFGGRLHIGGGGHVGGGGGNISQQKN